MQATAPPRPPRSDVRIDNTPPTTSQNDPASTCARPRRSPAPQPTRAPASTTSTSSAPRRVAGPGRRSPRTRLRSTASRSSFDTTTVSDGHYDFRTVAYDVAGNQAAATPVTDRLVDNTRADGDHQRAPVAYLRGAVNLTSSTGDPGGSNASGVVTVAYEYSTNGGSTLAVDRLELQLGRGRRRQRRPARRRNRRGRQRDRLGSGHELRRQHEAQHDRQRTERLAVQPGHRHAERRTTAAPASTSPSTASTATRATPSARASSSRLRQTARTTASHIDRLLLGRQRRQHRDDQEHDRADRRDAADLPVLLGCRLPARNGHAQRRPRQQRAPGSSPSPSSTRTPAARRGRRSAPTRTGPGPYTTRLGYDACARRSLRPAHSDHGQRRQRHNGEPA